MASFLHISSPIHRRTKPCPVLSTYLTQFKVLLSLFTHFSMPMKTVPACWGFDDLFFNLLLEFMHRDAKSKDILIHKYQILEVTDSGVVKASTKWWVLPWRLKKRLQHIYITVGHVFYMVTSKISQIWLKWKI